MAATPATPRKIAKLCVMRFGFPNLAATTATARPTETKVPKTVSGRKAAKTICAPTKIMNAKNAPNEIFFRNLTYF